LVLFPSTINYQLADKHHRHKARYHSSDAYLGPLEHTNQIFELLGALENRKALLRADFPN
jgi:hypothetical protein